MPEIGIADKATLDQVLAYVSALVNNGVIQPSKYYVAKLNLGSSYTPSTWYTVINVTSGTGILNFIGATCGGPGPGYYKYKLRITIDGTVLPIITISNSYGYGRSNDAVGKYFPHVFFKSSLKVEISTDISSDVTCYACEVDYALV